MKHKVRNSVLAIITCLALCNFVCTPSQEKKAAQFADTFAHSVMVIHSAVDVAHASGKVSDADYQAILKDLLEANQDGLKLNNIIRGVAAGTTITAQLNIVVQEIESALTDGTSHIKNPTTLKEIQVVVDSINLTLTSIESLYGGK
jgi:hypothetical protein